MWEILWKSNIFYRCRDQSFSFLTKDERFLSESPNMEIFPQKITLSKNKKKSFW